MKGIQTSTAAPFVLTIEARVCDCAHEPTAFKAGRTLDAVIPTAEGYWNVWLAFYGDQLQWLVFTIVDIRDGAVWWRNGRRTEGVTSATLPNPTG